MKKCHYITGVFPFQQTIPFTYSLPRYWFPRFRRTFPTGGLSWEGGPRRHGRGGPGEEPGSAWSRPLPPIAVMSCTRRWGQAQGTLPLPHPSPVPWAFGGSVCITVSIRFMPPATQPCTSSPSPLFRVFQRPSRLNGNDWCRLLHRAACRVTR